MARCRQRSTKFNIFHHTRPASPTPIYSSRWGHQPAIHNHLYYILDISLLIFFLLLYCTLRIFSPLSFSPWRLQIDKRERLGQGGFLQKYKGTPWDGKTSIGEKPSEKPGAVCWPGASVYLFEKSFRLLLLVYSITLYPWRTKTYQLTKSWRPPPPHSANLYKEGWIRLYVYSNNKSGDGRAKDGAAANAG